MDAGLTEEDAKDEAAKVAAAMHMQRNFRGFQVRRDLVVMEEKLTATRVQAQDGDGKNKKDEGAAKEAGGEDGDVVEGGGD